MKSENFVELKTPNDEIVSNFSCGENHLVIKTSNK